MGRLCHQPLGIPRRRLRVCIWPGRAEARSALARSCCGWCRAAIVSPFAGVLGGSLRRARRALRIRAGALPARLPRPRSASAAEARRPWSAPAIAATSSIAPFRSARPALTPTLARRPSELTAANACRKHDRKPRVLPGTRASAGLLLAVTGIDVVFGLTAALLGVSALLVLRIRRRAVEVPRGKSRLRRSSANASRGSRWSDATRRCAYSSACSRRRRSSPASSWSSWSSSPSSCSTSATPGSATSIPRSEWARLSERSAPSG